MEKSSLRRNENHEVMESEERLVINCIRPCDLNVSLKKKIKKYFFYTGVTKIFYPNRF